MKNFLTIKKVREILNVSEVTVNRLMYKRKIPFFKIGGLIRFDEEDVNQYLQDNYWDWAKHPKIKI